MLVKFVWISCVRHMKIASFKKKCPYYEYWAFSLPRNILNIGLTIPGNWSFEIMCEIRQISPVKSGGFHTWNLYEIHQISPEIAGFHLKSARFHEIHMKSAGFHLKSIWNLPDFTWNPLDFMKSTKSTRFHEIRQISWMWAFAWWSSIGLSFERPINDCQIKRKTKWIPWKIRTTWRNSNPMCESIVSADLIEMKLQYAEMQ